MDVRLKKLPSGLAVNGLHLLPADGHHGLSDVDLVVVVAVYVVLVMRMLLGI
jgi:hypothetical protein